MEQNKPDEKLKQATDPEMIPAADTPNKKQSQSLFFIAGGLLVLLVIVVAIILATNAKKPSTDITNDSASTEATSENTELSSNTVTATIDNKSITYNAAYVVDGINATISSGTYESSTDDQVVFLVINGGTLKIDGDVTINKTGSENFQGRDDDYSFYGTNSAIVVVGEGSSIAINGVTISTNVSGANAIVATNGGEALIENSKIATGKDGSRGLHATFGGYINADGIEIATLGGSSASIATDRGEGSIIANNMKLSTAGAGSPLIYSTGNITVTNSTGISTGAQIAVVEGKNSINIQGCEFSATGNGNRNNVDNAGVMIYQSMSGDADEGTGSFTATDCTLKVNSSTIYDQVPFFFITNTNANIDLTGTTVEFSKEQVFISAKGTTEWGRSGANGGKVTITTSDLTATNTKTDVDSISSVTGL